ncbi:MAG: hypothetical protein WCB68_24175 [Pyrinomonadaceae bacterium]
MSSAFRFIALSSRATPVSRFLLLLATACAALAIFGTHGKTESASGPPVLITEMNSTRAIAMDAVTFTREPFALTEPVLFSNDSRTRIMLFATNLTLLSGEGASVVTADAEDAAHIHYPLQVEYVGPVPDFGWMSSIVLRLNDNLGDVGDVLVGVTYHGATSNRVRVGIGHVGGGPPDDTGGGPVPDLGAGASLHGKQVFPSDNAWNQDISASPVDPNSANLINSIGAGTGLHPDFGTVYAGAPNGIPYVVVAGSQTKVPINFSPYGGESDPGPYPVPANAPIEGGPNSNGDRHVIVIDRDNWKLYELYSAYPQSVGASWNAASGAVFDLNSNALRTAGWTSADAAGLPIFPGLVRYDEVFEQQEIKHALRFTVQTSRRAYVAPARHFASSNTSANLPPMGMRVRLKASFDISKFSPAIQVILKAMKKYGMIVADNGSNWYISGAPDPRWSDDELSTLRNVKGSDFEVVQMGTIVTQ